MPSVLITVNRDGVRQVLTSPETRAAIRKIAEETAARARARVDEAENPIEVVEGGESRARAYVRMTGASAAAREAKHRILGSALPGGQ